MLVETLDSLTDVKAYSSFSVRETHIKVEHEIFFEPVESFVRSGDVFLSFSGVSRLSGRGNARQGILEIKFTQPLVSFIKFLVR
jgi:hypothetical protein